ncbi:MAG: hypothetical protein J2P26_03830 [Nocardiopsaceae bacterium]|nr:hypothetical protein [Nocardiopsaceae bacterium]
MYLVCTHGRRDRCCARLGGPLARALAPDYRDELWETTHVGGHKFAANLVLLPHGRYYGPCDLEVARAAIGACERGATEPRRYRGRAGQPAADQEAEHATLTLSEQLRLFLCKMADRVSRSARGIAILTVCVLPVVSPWPRSSSRQ